MKSNQRKSWTALTRSSGKILLLLLAGLWISACNKDSTGPQPNPPSNELQLSKEAQGASKAGWQTLNFMKTNEQFSTMVAGQDGFFTDEQGMVNSMAEVRGLVKKGRRVYSLAAQDGSFNRLSGDSLIWFQEWSDPISGTAGRRAFYYNDSTGIGRIYETIFQFPPQVELRYDSTEIIIDFGESLQDSSDDRFLNLSKLSLFNSSFVVQQVEASAQATDWDAQNNVTGALISNTVLYGTQIELLRLQQNGEFNPDQSGSINERLDYRDNTFRQSEVNFYPDFTGDFSEVWRNGITVTGTFDLLEDDNHARITRIITFPENPFVTRVEHTADYTLNPVDSSSVGILTEKVFFRNGGLDTARVEVERSHVSGNAVDHFIIQTSNRGQSDFTVTYFDTYNQIEGNHTTVDGFFVVFNAVEYQNGSGELWMSVYASRQAYENGEDPLLTLHIRFNGDGSGSGEITEDGKTYQVKYAAGGEIEVVDTTGKKASLSGY